MSLFLGLRDDLDPPHDDDDNDEEEAAAAVSSRTRLHHLCLMLMLHDLSFSILNLPVWALVLRSLTSRTVQCVEEGDV